ncbi:MAG: OpgC domain-containing protein, partial [Candidatus Methylacidiphilales bacterium]
MQARNSTQARDLSLALQKRAKAERNPFADRVADTPAAGKMRLGVLDFIRGLLLVLITVNHFPGPHAAFTYERLGFFTWAEGFVFLAGITGGLFWGRGLERSGSEEFCGKVWARAREIYVWHLCTVALVVALGMAVTVFTSGTAHAAYGAWFSNNLAPFTDRPLVSWLLAGGLMILPSLLDVLPMYCLFLLAAPFAYMACHAGRVKTVLAVSVGIWIAAYFGLGSVFTFWMPAEWRAGFHVFDPFAWQLLFVIGMVCGHLAARNELPAWVTSRWTLAGAGLLALSFFAMRLPWEMWGVHVWTFPHEMVDRRLLPPVRLMSFLAVALLFSALYRAKPHWFAWEPLERLGRNSLPAFSAHIVYLYTFTYW